MFLPSSCGQSDLLRLNVLKKKLKRKERKNVLKALFHSNFIDEYNDMNAFFSLVLWSTIVYSWSGLLMAISSYIVTIFYYHNFSFITCKQSKKVFK